MLHNLSDITETKNSVQLRSYTVNNTSVPRIVSGMAYGLSTRCESQCI